MFTCLQLGFKARENGETNVEPSRSADLAMEMLRQDLESGMPPNGTFKGSFTGSSATDERGHEADVLDLYTTADGPEHVDANGEIKLVELAVEVPSGSSDHVLVRRVRRNLSAQNPPDPDEEVICRGVSMFQLEYFDGSQWQPSWDSTQDTDANQNPALPAAVRVTLELERPQKDGSVKTYHYEHVYAVSCSTLLPGTNGGSSGSGGLGL